MNVINRIRKVYGKRMVYPINRKHPVTFQTKRGDWIETDALYALGKGGEIIKVVRVKL